MPGALLCSTADADGKVTEEEIKAAREAATKRKIAVVVAGLPDSYESEAFDREHMRLPDGHLRLIEAVREVNPNIVVVLLGGSVMELPFADKVGAILYAGLPGQAGGEAIADLLTGRASPSGKLTESWPISYDDVISKDTFGVRDPEYKESIYVGYRYYDKAGRLVRYPFGHGLSYTKFEYKNLSVNGREVSFDIENVGEVAGKEVVQLYIAPKTEGIHRPVRELKGFEKIELMPREVKNVKFTLDDRSFALWQGGWRIPGGEYVIEIGASSRDIRLTHAIIVDGERIDAPKWQNGSWYENPVGVPSREAWEKVMGESIPPTREPKKGEFTMDNSCLEMKPYSLMMKIQYLVTKNIISKDIEGPKDMTNPTYRMMMTAAVDCPMRGAVISSGGMMSESLARGMVMMANGHIIKGVIEMTKKS